MPLKIRLFSSTSTTFFRCYTSQHGKSWSIARLLEWKPQSSVDHVTVNGYVRSVRAMKSQRFVMLGDGSCLASLQALVPLDQAESLAVGAAVRLTGSWEASPAKGQSHELHARQVDVLGPSDAKTFPLQKKYHTAEYLRTMPHLRPRTPFNATLLRLRSSAIASLTQHFAGQGFTQTHTPVITSTDCEGAGEVFSAVPAGQLDAATPFFRHSKHLTVSAQLHLEALAQAVGHVWTLSPTFRAEQSDTSRHLSEFYMLEAEMSFVHHLSAVMDQLESTLRQLSADLGRSAVVDHLLARTSHSSPDLAPADEIRARWDGLMQASWPRIRYAEALHMLEEKSNLFAHTPKWGQDLQSEHEKYLAMHVGGPSRRPVFITHYPRDLKAFYMKLTDSHVDGCTANTLEPGPTVDCFDLLVPEFCEIAGGSMREHRLGPLMEAMQARGMSLPRLQDEADAQDGANGHHVDEGPLAWYVDLRRWGCPPHGGYGVGFDRLLAYLSGVQTVRDVVAFPRWFGRCDC